jgi:hypothetical protein
VDFRTYGRVLWRFKFVVALGLIAAVALGALSVLKISPSGKISYRQSELWSATTRLGVTQTGFPWGRLFAQQASSDGTPLTPSQEAARAGIPIADPNRLTTLAVLYSELASSDQVAQLMRRDGPIRGQILATNVVVGDNRIMLPLIDLMAVADSPKAATALALRSASALTSYVRDQQTANHVPDSDRVVLQAVELPRGAHVYKPRSKTMPVVVFLAVMLATVGLTFFLENLRPRPRRESELTEGDEPTAAGLRTAQRRTA